ncbi:hypothetical protein IW148_005925 [Coemansia sp. RSA 1199]|nr:hypothetical protein IW148_005925 [Coemansia sp. RSA 1199]
MDFRRKKVGSGGPFEDVVGYSRVLCAGPLVFVAGTTAGSDGSPIPESCEDQTRQTIEIIITSLNKVNVTLDEIVRVRMFVVNIKRNWEAVSRVMNLHFGSIKPVMTMVEVSGLIDDKMCIEIEMDAVRK